MPLRLSEKPIKIVLDTNNLISSQINKKGASFKIFKLFRKRKLIIFTSPFQLEELDKVLNYPRIRRKYRLNPKRIKLIVSLFKKYAQIVYPSVLPNIIKDDLADNQILAIAEEGKVDFIVSGDAHLLRLRKLANIPIISAKDFLRIVK